MNNNLSSSISYSKTFPGEPQVNVDIAATHNQNTRTQEVNLSLPNVSASMSRIFPFAPKVGIKKGIIDNVNFQYSFVEKIVSQQQILYFLPEICLKIQEWECNIISH